MAAQVKPGSLGQPGPVEISAQPITSFQREKPDRVRFGRLEWRGGLVLTSPSPDFGGLSGLIMDPEGRQILAISDAGTWLTADVAYAGEKPTGLRNARIGPLLGAGGRPLSRLGDRDAEGLTLAGGSFGKGTVLISFERNHRIVRYPLSERGLGAPTGFLKRPAEAARMDRNRGFEAVAVLKGGPLKGSTVAFAERFLDPRGHHTGWIWTGEEPRKLYLVNRDGFDITDAASLDDGTLLVLERRFRWLEGVKMRLRLVRPREIVPDAVIEGETLLEADMAFEIDNMEGVSVHRGARGETVITLISDDNFNHLLQRTLLLQFTLHEKAEARAQ